MSATPFSPDVVAAVTQHMNDDHPDDTLLIAAIRRRLRRG